MNRWIALMAAALPLACGPKGSRTPQVPALAPWTVTTGAAQVRAVDLGADGSAVVGLAVTADAVIAGTKVSAAPAVVMALAAGGAPRWQWQADGDLSALAIGDDSVAVALSTRTSGSEAGSASDAFVTVKGRKIPTRGQPGAVVVGLAASSGEVRFAMAAGATEWVTIRDTVVLPGGDVAIGGAFAGTLRLGDRVVSSAGASDGFVGRLGPDGAVRWLVRVGGHHGDAVAGIAALDDGVALAGTFSVTADLRGLALEVGDPRTLAPDGFVAALAADGAPRWAQSFGSDVDDAVAGIAVTAGGDVAVAMTVREVVQVAGVVLIAQGIADAAVGVWDGRGQARGAVQLGGADYDGVRAITAIGDRVAVAGWFSGAMRVPGDNLTAGGGQDGMIATASTSASVAFEQVTPFGGPGREDVPALAGSAAGWLAAVTADGAAELDGAHLDAPAAGATTSAIVFRPLAP